MTNIKKLILTGIFFIVAIPITLQTQANEFSIDSSAQEIIIFDQGLEYGIFSKGGTVEEALTNAGVEVQENDIIFPSLGYEIDSGQYPVKIIIERAIPVSLNIYSQTKKIYSRGETIMDVIESQGIEFQDDDYINYNFYEEIFPGIEIKIWKKPGPEPELEPTPEPVKITKTGEVQTGIASWYSYVPGNFCASPTYTIGTKLLVTNLANGKTVVVTVNDVGPFNGPIIDLERNVFLKLSPLWKGVINVKVEKITVH